MALPAPDRGPARGAARLGASAALILLSGTWTWWALEQGAYFGTVLYPGLVLLCAGVVVLAWGAPWQADLALSRGTRLAILALVALAALSALSALWSPAPDVAIADAQRIAGYALAFGLGLGLCNLARARMYLAMAPLALAGAVAGVVTLVALLGGGEVSSYLETDGTLQYPLGYRNANAAFFAIALWPSLALAQARELPWPARCAAIATATLCAELALLSQSRGSVPAFAAAMVVYAILMPHRARALGWLAVAVLPALFLLPAISDVYSATNELGRQGAAEPLRDAGQAALGGCLLALIAGAAAIRVGRLRPLGAQAAARTDRLAARVALGALAVGAAIFVAVVGDPVEWVDQRLDEARDEGTPAFAGESSRFAIGVGTERLDLWRVALERAGAEPLLGDGAGAFQYAFMRERERPAPNARDAHSVELEVLSELGIPGLALLLAAVAGGAAGALTARRLGPSAAALSAAALSSGAYWVVHASVDWLWAFPAVTAPVLALAGAACAPAVRVESARALPGRLAVSVAAAALALTVIPPFLAERYTQEAFAEWRTDPGHAYEYLERARALNPLAEEPWLAEGAIAQAAGAPQRAAAAFAEAARMRPEEWAAHYFLADLHAKRKPRRAREEIARALALNPLSERAQELELQLEADGRGRSARRR